jgi:hypothetical protein
VGAAGALRLLGDPNAGSDAADQAKQSDIADLVSFWLSEEAMHVREKAGMLLIIPRGPK